MKEVILSEHARFRCEQRGINTRRLIKMVETIPHTPHDLKWLFPNGIKVVIADEGDRRVIVTASKSPKRRGRRR